MRSFTARTIPGLRYELKRTDSVRRAEDVAPYQTVMSVVAEGSRVSLEDANPPENQAFYRIEVSVS